ncbi:MAG: hypothetical protein Q7J54_04975 [Candidatus Woesearchaeota archaeon]|nr:hypothetical protein [Candidatus Woesearchaeota archaeon]
MIEKAKTISVIAVGNSKEDKVPDRKGIGQKGYLVRNFGLQIDELNISKLWLIETKPNDDAGYYEIAEEILINPVIHSYALYAGFDPFAEKYFNKKHVGDWILRFGFKTQPFVSDVEGEFVQRAIKDVLGIELSSLRTASQYTLRGKLNKKDLEVIANQSPIDSKCHKVIYFPIDMDNMGAMQSPISKRHQRLIYRK